MEILKCDAILEVPKEVAVCPKCDGKLYVQFDAWEEDDDGTWYAAFVHTECENEPEIDSEDYEEWFDWHYDMPYVDWLPIDDDVERWLKQNYRFDIRS